MSNDLIRRQDAIERATKEHDFYKGATIPTDKARRDELLNVMCWLGELPSAQPEQQWTPCSERLPEEYGNYLITTYDGNVDIGTIDPKGKSVWSACDADGFYWMRDVIAWMPLPEPWKGAKRC